MSSCYREWDKIIICYKSEQMSILLKGSNLYLRKQTHQMRLSRFSSSVLWYFRRYRGLLEKAQFSSKLRRSIKNTDTINSTRSILGRTTSFTFYMIWTWPLFKEIITVHGSLIYANTKFFSILNSMLFTHWSRDSAFKRELKF